MNTPFLIAPNQTKANYRTPAMQAAANDEGSGGEHWITTASGKHIPIGGASGGASGGGAQQQQKPAGSPAVTVQPQQSKEDQVKAKMLELATDTSKQQFATFRADGGMGKTVLFSTNSDAQGKSKPGSLRVTIAPAAGEGGAWQHFERPMNEMAKLVDQLHAKGYKHDASSGDDYKRTRNKPQPGSKFATKAFYIKAGNPNHDPATGKFSSGTIHSDLGKDPMKHPVFQNSSRVKVVLYPKSGDMLFGVNKDKQGNRVHKSHWHMLEAHSLQNGASPKAATDRANKEEEKVVRFDIEKDITGKWRALFADTQSGATTLRSAVSSYNIDYDKAWENVTLALEKLQDAGFPSNLKVYINMDGETHISTLRPSTTKAAGNPNHDPATGKFSSGGGAPAEHPLSQVANRKDGIGTHFQGQGTYAIDADGVLWQAKFGKSHKDMAQALGVDITEEDGNAKYDANIMKLLLQQGVSRIAVGGKSVYAYVPATNDGVANLIDVIQKSDPALKFNVSLTDAQGKQQSTFMEMKADDMVSALENNFSMKAAHLLKAGNPNHDPHTGKFTSAGGESNAVWQRPDADTLKREYKVEYQGHYKYPGNDPFPTEQSFLDAIAKAPVVEIDPEMDRRISGRSHTSSMKELLGLISGYRSYPQFRNENTLAELEQRIKTGAPTDLPIVMRRQGSMQILSGNTRLDIAFMHGTRAHVIMLDTPNTQKSSGNPNHDARGRFASGGGSPEEVMQEYPVDNYFEKSNAHWVTPEGTAHAFGGELHETVAEKMPENLNTVEKMIDAGYSRVRTNFGNADIQMRALSSSSIADAMDIVSRLPASTKTITVQFKEQWDSWKGIAKALEGLQEMGDRNTMKAAGNPHHDPMTGHFTYGPGNATADRMAVQRAQDDAKANYVTQGMRQPAPGQLILPEYEARQQGTSTGDDLDLTTEQGLQNAASETGGSRVFNFSTGEGQGTDKNVKFFTNMNAEGRFARGMLRVEIVDPETQKRGVYARQMNELPKLVKQLFGKKYNMTSQHRWKTSNRRKAIHWITMGGKHIPIDDMEGSTHAGEYDIARTVGSPAEIEKPKPKEERKDKKQPKPKKLEPTQWSYADDKLSFTRDHTEEERQAMAAYGDGAYGRINKTLRRKDFDWDKVNEGDKQTILALDSLIESSQVNEPITVYRGFASDDVLQRWDKIVGSTFRDKGFISTSLTPKIAGDFSVGQSKRVEAEIKLPAGYKGAWISHSSGHDEEQEVLLGRRTAFDVIGAREENGKRIITMRPRKDVKFNLKKWFMLK